jgi:hypothetical protein
LKLASHSSDIDLFLYGLTTEQAIVKAKEIMNHFSSFIENGTVCIMRTQHSLTFMPFGAREFKMEEVKSDDKDRRPARVRKLRRDIQVVLRLYNDPAEVLLGFDIDSCCVGYNGTHVYCLPRWQRAITMV